MYKQNAVEKAISIVVVEDDDGHAFLIEKNLKRAGLINPLTHLKTGREAMDFFSGRDVRNQSPANLDNSIVLLDLHLPDFDGFSVLEKIRETPSLEHLPVLILSSTTRDEEIRRCYHLGCSIFLNKPVDYASFSEAILQLGLLLKIVKVQT